MQKLRSLTIRFVLAALLAAAVVPSYNVSLAATAPNLGSAQSFAVNEALDDTTEDGLHA